MRINRYIASAGICSRRKADELVAAGKVRVNGTVLVSPGYDVVDGDRVEVDGETIRPSLRKLYYAFNKPTGVITTASDEQGRLSVMEFFDDIEERVFPVGRLDMNTSGLLFVTNDGEFSDHVMHPSVGIEKVYLVRVAGEMKKSALARLRKGVDIGGFVTGSARVTVISQNRRSSLVEIGIREGKNRQVRRMFAAVGYPVQELTRIAIGNIRLGHLKPGQYRKLTAPEIEYIMRS